ncbi:MAG: PIN domain-containing protein [Chloroflexia bacterium]
MPSIFVDTSAWGYFVDPSEQAYHDKVTELYRNVRDSGDKLVTTSLILTELIALLTSPLRVPRSQAIRFFESIRSAPHIEVVFIDQVRDEQAWNLLSRRPDKLWSLVDCASFVVMQELGITEALTTDHHFEQAGFIRLLKPQS